jgi:hypothetical protein
MANQTDTPKTIGARLAFAYSLYPTPEVFSLRNLDEWCEPRLGGGHCAQIIAGKIKEPRRATLKAIAKVLGCSYAWLAEGEGRAPGKRAVREAVDLARSAANAVREEIAALGAAAGEGVAK